MISRTEVNAEEHLASQEKFHTDAINKEKAAYNETIEYLRKLKGTIEHQQRSVEKARTRMQSDFDAWYREMCSQDLSMQPKGIETTQSPAKSSGAKPNTKSTGTIPPTQPPTPPPVTAEAKPEEPEFVLPPGIKLTGNKEADDDIIAFFKAKQVLLSRAKKK
jgi:kinesin family protein 6/9